jgi:hypothetical protein
MQVVEPNVFDSASFAVSEDDCFADKRGLGFIKLGNCGCRDRP